MVQKKFAVFDIDGTLIRWQLYHSITQKLADAGELGTDAQSKIDVAKKKWKQRETSDGFSQYEKAILHAYEDSLYSMSPKKFDSFVNGVIEEHKQQVYIYTRDLVKKLKSEDYFLLAISGSHQELVEKIAAYYDFDDFVGTQYERSEETYTGKKFAPSKDKHAALLSLINKHDLSYEGSIAIGDSLSDAPMLSMVENPIAFNPDSKLFGYAKQKGWKIVVERKNMVYELEYKDNAYRLR